MSSHFLVGSRKDSVSQIQLLVSGKRFALDLDRPLLQTRQPLLAFAAPTDV